MRTKFWRPLALTVVVLAFAGTACAPAMGPYRYTFKNPTPEVTADLRVGVLPAEDERGAATLDDTSDGIAWIPGFLWWSSYYDRPEEHAEPGVDGFPAWAAAAAQKELDGLRVFRSVQGLDGGSEDSSEVDLILRTRVHETKQRQLTTAYGGTFLGAGAWLIGMPSGATTVTLDIAFTLEPARGGKPLVNHRERVELTEYTNVWWGMRPREVMDAAFAALFAEFAAKIEPAVKELEASGGASLAGVAARESPLAEAKVAFLDLARGEGVSDSEASAIGALIAAELAKRAPRGLVTQADINNMIGFEQVKELVGCESTKCAVEIGGALGVDYLASGSITALGQSLVFSISLIDLKRSKAVGRVARKVPREELESLADALPGVLDELLGYVEDGEGS